MSYVLLGSQTSPFVRRIRMLMEDLPYEFKEMNIFETGDALNLNKINPLNQIPVLLDGDLKVWDSRQIFNYINLIHKLHNMSWEDENTLTAIDGAMNSGVSLLLMKRSGMKTDEPYMFINRQKERMESVLDYLKPFSENHGLKDWNFLSMSLYCFLDWALFRGLINIDSHPECQKFLATYAEKTIVKSTQIPKV
jgi:glutathione S-transferase